MKPQKEVEFTIITTAIGEFTAMRHANSAVKMTLKKLDETEIVDPELFIIITDILLDEVI